MDATKLRKHFLRLLKKEVGVYANGTPSIWVYGSGKKPPSSSNGLEVLISSIANQPAQAASGGIKYKPQEWEVTLKNYAESQSLVSSLRKIEKHFIVLRFTYMPATEQTIERCRLFIFDPIVI